MSATPDRFAAPIAIPLASPAPGDEEPLLAGVRLQYAPDSTAQVSVHWFIEEPHDERFERITYCWAHLPSPSGDRYVYLHSARFDLRSALPYTDVNLADTINAAARVRWDAARCRYGTDVVPRELEPKGHKWRAM